MATATIPTKPNGGNFHSSGLRQKIDQLMDILWSGGLNNPMDAIEQLSYMLFLRLLWEKDELLASLDKRYKKLFSGDWAKYGWGNFVPLTGDDLFNSLRGALEKIHELPGLSETGKLLFDRATLKIYDRPTLRAAVQGIASLDLVSQNGGDPKGDMYEYLLSKLAMSGTNGQFRTPRHIIDMIVGLVQPQPGERICDPACGTAGFLIASFNYILRTHTSKASLAKGHPNGDLLKPQQWKFLEEQAFTGYDNDANMVKIAILNLYLHELEKADIEFHNPLTTSKGTPYPGMTFDAILANPPFAGKIQKESILADINLDTRDTELLFLKWFVDHLSPGGRAGVIVPNGVLFGSTKSARKLRELLLTDCELQGIINMPSGVFRPYSGVGTAALIFQKRVQKLKLEAAEGFVWFYDITADGYSLDDKRTPIAANDVPDVVMKWAGREEGVNSYRVPVAKIRDQRDLSFATGPYKPVSNTPVNHDEPIDILSGVLNLEKEILRRGDALLHQVTKKR